MESKVFGGHSVRLRQSDRFGVLQQFQTSSVRHQAHTYKQKQQLLFKSTNMFDMIPSLIASNVNSLVPVAKLLSAEKSNARVKLKQ